MKLIEGLCEKGVGLLLKKYTYILKNGFILVWGHIYWIESII